MTVTVQPGPVFELARHDFVLTPTTLAEALPIRAGPPTFGEGAVTACKFLAPPCRTTLFGPRTLDPAAAVASTEKPGAHLRLEHCYGYNGRV